jgi:hypothetical protein
VLKRDGGTRALRTDLQQVVGKVPEGEGGLEVVCGGGQRTCMTPFDHHFNTILTPF